MCTFGTVCPVYLVTVVVEGEQKQRLQNQINASGSRTKLSTSWPSFWRIHANTRLSHWVTDCLGMIIGIDDNDGLFSNNGLTKVLVFYCLMKKFKSQNFYQSFLSWFSTNLDEFGQDWSK